MDKRVFVNLQGGRKVSGTLRGYDLFLNLVLDNAKEETAALKNEIDTVVCVFLTSYLDFDRTLAGNPW
jgi:small nuclear ribonucleoprotein (snRNP)-like protein